MHLLEAENLTVRYGGFTALDGLSFSLDEGEWLMLIGPNGAGKSTALGAISGGVASEGKVLYRGENIRALKPKTLARAIGTLSQNHSVNYAFTVREVVRLGRYAYSGGLFGRGDVALESEIDRALALTGLTSLSDHSVLTLSGGELQRVFLAQLFAQDPQILLLDEPTNHLDLIYQQQIFSLIDQWRKEPGRAVISVVHDLSLARAYGTRAILLNGGKKIADGSVGDVFSPEKLREAYDMDVYAWMQQMLAQWQSE